MRDIDERADHIIVWLGEKNGTAKMAFEGIQDAAEVTDEWGKSRVFGVMKRIREPEEEAALDNLLKRGWFQRIWVIQDLVCACKANIMYGDQAMEWERFLGFAER